MKLETFEIILNKFPEASLLMLAGVGEPLLNPSFLEIIELGAKHKKMMNLVTNGTLLNKNIIEKIVNNKRFNQISISLNASNEKDYKAVCNVDGEKFHKVVENIKYLVEYKKKYNSNIQIIVSAVCSEQFIDYVLDFISFATSLGVNRIDIHNYIDFSIIEKSAQWTPISNNKELKEKFNNIREIIRNRNDNTIINLPGIYDKTTFSKKCEWFFKNISFDSHGNIGSCGRVMSPNSKYGNINGDEDIWNNKYMQHMRKSFLDQEKHIPGCCTKCIENFL